jgi:DMT superfamily multidrug transporter emrE
MAYLFLTLAIILETVGTVCIKLSDGFTKSLPTVGTCLAYIACFYFISLSLKTISLGFVYAVWAGLGIVLGNIISVVFFKQQFDFAAGIGVTLIVAGVVVLNLFSAASAH